MDYDKKFERWLTSGVNSIPQLRRKIKRHLRNTRNSDYRAIMKRLTWDEEYAEDFLGLAK